MPKTLYVSDLDGTLLNSHDRLPEFTIQALNRLLDEGLLFTFATARSWYSAHVVTQGLVPSLPWIVHNGAFMVDGATGERADEVFFGPEERDHILRAAGERNMLVYAMIDGRERVLYRTDIPLGFGMDHYVETRQGDPRLYPVEGAGALRREDTYTFTFLDEQERLAPLWEQLRGLDWLNFTFQQELYREEYWLEVYPKAATKANAALRLKEALGCEKLVAFGDAMNDLPLFRAADESYAVANAMEAVKQAATGIIGGCEDSGVAKFLLERLGESGGKL